MLHMVENGRDTEEDKGDITEMLTNMSRMDVITEGNVKNGCDYRGQQDQKKRRQIES